MARITPRAVAIAALTAASACAPFIGGTDVQSVVEGDGKRARATIISGLCPWRLDARMRREGAASWVDLPAPTMTSGEVRFLDDSNWASAIAGAEDFRQGERFEVHWRAPYWGGGWFCPPDGAPEVVQVLRTFAVSRPFGVSTEPASLEIARGGSATIDVRSRRFGSFSGDVTLGWQNAGTGVAPAPASAVASGSGPNPQSTRFTLEAAAGAAVGTRTLTVVGSSPGRTTQRVDVPITILGPRVSSVSPAMAARGDPIAVSGERFDPACGSNTLTVGGATALVTACSATMLSARVPQDAALGAGQLSVTSAGAASNAVAFTVARQQGAFTEITPDVRGAMASPLLCGTGAVRLTLSMIPGANRPHRASFHRTADGFLLGAIDFERDTPVIDTQSASDLGGAGFSHCSTGVVLDADARDDTDRLLAFRFLRLDGAGQFAKGFSLRTRQVDVATTTVSPRLFRSPDGTVFVALVASSLGNVKKAIVIDREDGRSTDVELHSTGDGFAARVTPANAVAIAFDGRSFGPIAIP